jgi:hypothetical protein
MIWVAHGQPLLVYWAGITAQLKFQKVSRKGAGMMAMGNLHPPLAMFLTPLMAFSLVLPLWFMIVNKSHSQWTVNLIWTMLFAPWPFGTKVIRMQCAFACNVASRWQKCLRHLVQRIPTERYSTSGWGERCWVEPDLRDKPEVSTHRIELPVADRSQRRDWYKVASCDAASGAFHGIPFSAWHCHLMPMRFWSGMWSIADGPRAWPANTLPGSHTASEVQHAAHPQLCRSLIQILKDAACTDDAAIAAFSHCGYPDVTWRSQRRSSDQCVIARLNRLTFLVNAQRKRLHAAWRGVWH